MFLSFWAYNELGTNQTELAQIFRISQPAVSAAVRKGEILVNNNGYMLSVGQSYYYICPLVCPLSCFLSGEKFPDFFFENLPHGIAGNFVEQYYFFWAFPVVQVRLTVRFDIGLG